MADYVISIIIPIYNTAPYLRECLDSVLQQTALQSATTEINTLQTEIVDDTPRIEIICINDGSTDDSLSILNEYVKERSPEQVTIRVLSQANKGLSAARNAGMAIATGEYILFLDSDDCLTPDALAVLLPLLDGQTDIVAFNSVLWYLEEDDRKVENRMFNHTEQYIYSRGFDYLCRFVQQRGWGPSAACFYAYRMELLTEYALSFPVGLLHEDELFVPQALCIAGRTCTLPMPLYLYRMRTTSIAHTDNLQHAEDKQTIALRLYDYFRQNGWRNRWTDRLVYNLMLNAAMGLAANGKRVQRWLLLLRTAHTAKEYVKALTKGTKRCRR